MSLSTIINSDTTNEFRDFLETLAPHLQNYADAKSKAQIERMIIIGMISEYRQIFPQRSADHKALTKAMEAEGWSRDVIDSNSAAYQWYKKNIEAHSDWHPLVHAASVTHMQVFARASSGELEYYALKYLKRNKCLPPVSALRGYLAGHFTDQFQHRYKNRPIKCADDEARQEFLVEPLPVIQDLQVQTPSVDTVQRGINMLIAAIHELGSIDDLSTKPKYIEQLRPYYVTLDMLSAAVSSRSPCAFLR